MQALQHDDVGDPESWLSRGIAEQQNDLKRWEQPFQQAGEVLFGLIKASDVQAGVRNIGYSFASGTPLTNPAVVGIVPKFTPGTAKAIPYVVAYLASALQNGAMAYRATYNQTVTSYLDRLDALSLDQRGRKLTREERVASAGDSRVRELVGSAAAFEAWPEAIVDSALDLFLFTKLGYTLPAKL